MDRQRAHSLRPTAVALGLTAAVAAVYGRTAGHGFVGYDDTTYVTDNPMVRPGLTAQGVAWAFRTGYAANWHPLTWLSHMADVTLFGMNPAGHHLVNVLLHGANAVLLFLLLRAMTGALWRSGFVALLFAVHPLHVESVAWVAERKDVLSSLWGLLATAAYLRWARRPRGARRRAPAAALVALNLAIGLLAKPMLVTLPFLFLLLDYWPLGRLGTRLETPSETCPGAPSGTLPGAVSLVAEKLPLFALAAASSIVTYRVQQLGGMVKELEAYPFGVRVATALVAYPTYLVKMLLPVNLAMPYPHPGGAPPPALVLGGAALLAIVSVAALAARRSRPWLIVGWLWFLGMLFPVIGLVQIADQLMADRYTYLPLTGPFIALVWGVAELVRGRRRARRIALATGVPLLVGLAAAAWVQTGHWKDSDHLMAQALRATKDNYLVNNNMGFALAWEGRRREAEAYYREAVRIRPRYGKAHFNLANLLASLRRDPEAEEHYQAALGVNESQAEAHNNLGVLLERNGRLEEALRHYRRAAELRPSYADARNSLGSALLRLGRVEEAAAQLREAVRLAPAHPYASYNLGLAALRLNRRAEAREAFAAALRARPDDADARRMLEGLGDR